MAKANYRFEKRQRELKKQQRKEEKGKRKAEKAAASGNTTPEPDISNIGSNTDAVRHE